MDVGGKEITYLSLQCHHHKDFCIKMGSDESRFNVSVTVRDKVTRPCPQTTTKEGDYNIYLTSTLSPHVASQ